MTSGSLIEGQAGMSKSSRPSLAVVGCGYYGGVHAEILSGSDFPEIDLYFVSRQEEKARKFVKRFKQFYDTTKIIKRTSG